MEWLTSEDVFISESIFESIFTLYLLLPFWGGEGGGKMHLITRRVHLPLIMKRTRLTSACNVGDQGSIPGPSLATWCKAEESWHGGQLGGMLSIQQDQEHFIHSLEALLLSVKGW